MKYKLRISATCSGSRESALVQHVELLTLADQLARARLAQSQLVEQPHTLLSG